MLKKAALLFFFLIFSFFYPKPINAANEITKILNPVADSFINSYLVAQNRGNDNSIVVSRDLREPIVYLWGLVRFDLTDIPQNAQISQAVIRLHQLNTEEGGVIKNRSTIKMLRITQPWKERTVAWFNKPNFSEEGAVSTPLTDQIKHYDWDATELLKSWHNQQVSNYGVYFQVTSQTYHQWLSTFGSRESEHPPELIVTYTVPEEDQQPTPVPPSPTAKPVTANQESQATPIPTETIVPTSPPEEVALTSLTERTGVNLTPIDIDEVNTEEDIAEEDLLEDKYSTMQTEELKIEPETGLTAAQSKVGTVLSNIKKNRQLIIAIALTLISTGTGLLGFIVKDIQEKKKQGIGFKDIIKSELRAVKDFFNIKKHPVDNSFG